MTILAIILRILEHLSEAIRLDFVTSKRLMRHADPGSFLFCLLVKANIFFIKGYLLHGPDMLQITKCRGHPGR